MESPVNLTEEDLLALDQHSVAKLLAVPQEHRCEAIDAVRKIARHAAFNNENYNWTLDDFELGYSLSRGKFGKIYIAKVNHTDFIVGLKTIVKNEIRKINSEQHTMRGIEIQSRLVHPNILKLYKWFQDQARIYIVLEVAANGDLYNFLKAAPNQRFGDDLAAKYTYQMADALHYCHMNSVIHRDLKPENIMVTLDGDIKLADFGCSVYTPSMKRVTITGTLDYLPPEMVENKSYNESVDNWCLGILCYEMLVGYPPFESETSQETYARIRNLIMEFPDFISEGAIDLISKLLTKFVPARLTLPEVMDHPWIKLNYKM